MKKKFRVVKNFKIVKQSCSLNRYYRVPGHWPLSLSGNINKTLEIEIQKRVNKRESTRKVPCVKYEPRTCESIEKHQAIF